MKILFSFFISFILCYSVFSQSQYRNWTVQSNNKERIALIIANNNYQSSGNLSQPISSARKLETTLRNLNFDVQVAFNVNRTDMGNQIVKFAERYQNYQFALIVYLGHGFEIDGKNYLIPTDANPKSKYQVALQAIEVDNILMQLNNEKIPKMVILDACRENPFARKWAGESRGAGSHGFEAIHAPRNASVVFTTRKGAVVRDNNPYMPYFISEIKKGGCLGDILDNVDARVNQANRNQIPARYSTLFKFNNICFGRNKPKPNPLPNPNPEPESFTIYSSPSNASVYINGEYYGKTPLELNGTRGSQHQLKITKQGYETYRTSYFTINKSSYNYSLDPKDLIPNTVTIKGQTYKTVTIGNQTWLAENLNAYIDDSSCYDNNSSNCTKYGRLYSWEAAKRIANQIPGWHLPTDAEWDELCEALGGTKYSDGNYGYTGSPIGTYLKEGGSSGFNALLAGYRYSSGNFNDLGYYGFFSSASPSGGSEAFSRYVTRSNAGVYRNDYDRTNRFSVRLLKD